MNKDETRWRWSYHEQLLLYYRHDAYWIKLARNNWPGPEGDKEFETFLTSYGLRRGTIGSSLKVPSVRREVIGLCHDLFAGPLPNNDYFDEAQKNWNKATDALAKCLKCGNKPRALAMKIYWFHHPEKLPMYDQYSHKGLSSVMKKVTRDNFLLSFGEFFERNKGHIKEVAKNFNRKYVSPPRVADKYLWLRGSDWDDRDGYLTSTLKRSPFLK